MSEQDVGWGVQQYLGSYSEHDRTGMVLLVCALRGLQQRCGSTHLQKLSKTCCGQTIPEAVRPLRQQGIMDRDRTMRQGHNDKQHTTWTEM